MSALSAYVASVPVHLGEKPITAGLDAVRRQEVRLLLALDGRGTPERPLPAPLVHALRQYANVATLVFDLLMEPAFHRSLAGHHRLLPDVARSLVPVALALLELVPPARGGRRDTSTFGPTLLAAIFDPWVSSASTTVPFLAPSPGSPAASAAALKSAAGPSLLLAAAGRYAFSLLVPAVRRAETLGALVGAIPPALAALARAMTTAGDTTAATCATDLKAALDRAAAEAQATLERRIAGAAGTVEAGMELLRSGVTDELNRITAVMAGWKPESHTVTRLIKKDASSIVRRPLGEWEVERHFATAKSGVLTKSFWGVVPVLDLAWQTLYLYSAYASTDFDDGFEIARFVGVDALTGIGNIAGSASAVLNLWTTTRKAAELALTLGRVSWVIGWLSAGADIISYFVACAVELRPLLAGFRPEYADRIRVATYLTALGKVITFAGALAAPFPLASVVLSGLGVLLDNAGQVATSLLAGGAATAAAYDDLESRLAEALGVLARSVPAFDARELIDPSAVVALHRLRSFDAFRALDPVVAARYRLLEED